MTAQAKLTDTQTAILKAAAGRTDGNLEPLPPTLRGGARTKVIEGLLARGFVVEAGDRHLLTDAGYTAVGKRRRLAKGIQKMDPKDDAAKREATPRTIRPGTKLAVPARRKSPVESGLEGIWWARRDLNPGPKDYESSALTN